MPLVRYTLPNQGAMWTLLAVLCLCRSVAGQFTFSSVFALIANSVQPDVLGSVNCLGQMLVALFRMIGPVVAGPVYFWSINPPQGGVRVWPLNYWLVFLL